MNGLDRLIAQHEEDLKQIKEQCIELATARTLLEAFLQNLYTLRGDKPQTRHEEAAERLKSLLGNTTEGKQEPSLADSISQERNSHTATAPQKIYADDILREYNDHDKHPGIG